MTELRHELRRDGEKIRLALEGEIDMRVAPRLRKILHEALAANPPEVVVDMAKVPFIDSSGVATLVEALRLQMAKSRRLRITNPTEPVRYTFKITQLTKVFGIDEPPADGAAPKPAP